MALNFPSIGGGGSTPIVKGTHLYFAYDADKDKLIAKRRIKTKLASFELGDQYRISSSGDSVVFKNLTSEASQIPVHLDFPDQYKNLGAAQAENIDPAHTRIFGDFVNNLENAGAMNPTPGVATPYEASIVNSASTFAATAVSFVTEEAVLSSQFMFYTIQAGIDSTATPIYEEFFTGTAYSIGDTVRMELDTPFIVNANQPLYVTVTLAENQDVEAEDRVPMMVRATLADANRHYTILEGRPWELHEIYYRNDMGSESTGISLGDGTESLLAADIAIGSLSSATGGFSIALGKSVITTGLYGISLGYESSVTNTQDIAIGYQALATAVRATAIGRNAVAVGADDISIGTDSYSTDTSSIAIGNLAKGTSIGSVGVGSQAEAFGSNTIALGYNTLSSYANAISIGPNAASGSTESISIGSGATAGGTIDANPGAIAIGDEASASGGQSIAIGKTASAPDIKAVAIGLNAKANKIQSIAIGDNCVASADYSTVLGLNALASINAISSVVIGNFSEALGQESVAVGWGSRASNHNTVSIGKSATCVGLDAAAIGFNASSSGTKSVAFGYAASAEATGSVAIGRSARSTVSNAVAVGKSSQALADSSVALGESAKAEAQSGIAVGDFALASGDSSISIGRAAAARAADSLAIGYYATATAGSVAIGKDTFLNGTGVNNTALGYQAGDQITSGYNNTVLGFDAQVSVGSVIGEFVLGSSIISNLRCNDTSISALSDRRDKTDIQDSTFGLDYLNALRPVNFLWESRDGNAKDGTREVGFIAQELQAVSDEFGGEDLKTVQSTNPECLEADYGKLLVVAIKAIQELSAEVEALKNK